MISNLVAGDVEHEIDRFEVRNKFQYNIAAMVAEAIHALLETPDEILKIEKLDIVSNAMNAKSKTAFPNELISQDFLKEIYSLAFKMHDHPLSLTALRFIHDVIARNDEFDLDIVKACDINLISTLHNYIGDATKQEIEMIFSILSHFIRRRRDFAELIIEIFPFSEITTWLPNDNDNLFNLSAFTHAICYQFDNIEIIAPFYQFAFANLAVNIIEKRDIETVYNFVSSIHEITNKDIDFLAISPQPEEVSRLLAIAYKAKKLKVRIMVIEILQKFYTLTHKSKLFSVFTPKILINRISSPIYEDKNNTILTTRAMELLTDVITSGKYSFTPESVFMDNLRVLINCNTLEERFAALKLITALVEYGEHATKLNFLHSFNKHVLEFLESDDNDYLLYALRYAMSMCMFARPQGKIDVIINDLDEYKDIIGEIAMEHEDWMIQGFAKALDQFINDIENPEVEEFE